METIRESEANILSAVKDVCLSELSGQHACALTFASPASDYFFFSFAKNKLKKQLGAVVALEERKKKDFK